MWIVLELENAGLTPYITKHKKKSEALSYIEAGGYDMNNPLIWETEPCTVYEQDLNTCVLFSPRKIQTVDQRGEGYIEE